MWRNVDDFKWLRQQQSPNWCVLPEGERATATTGVLAPGMDLRIGSASSESTTSSEPKTAPTVAIDPSPTIDDEESEEDDEL